MDYKTWAESPAEMNDWEKGTRLLVSKQNPEFPDCLWSSNNMKLNVINKTNFFFQIYSENHHPHAI